MLKYLVTITQDLLFLGIVTGLLYACAGRFDGRRGRVILTVGALVGLAAGKPSMVGAGIASQRTEMYTEFARVRKVKVYPRRQVIKVNQRLMHNQVYALPEDFEFVKEFILARCPQAKR